jgi:hypothetical protein
MSLIEILVVLVIMGRDRFGGSHLSVEELGPVTHSEHPDACAYHPGCSDQLQARTCSVLPDDRGAVCIFSRFKAHATQARTAAHGTRALRRFDDLTDPAGKPAVAGPWANPARRATPAPRWRAAVSGVPLATEVCAVRRTAPRSICTAMPLHCLGLAKCSPQHASAARMSQR